MQEEFNLFFNKKKASEAASELQILKPFFEIILPFGRIQ